MENFSTACSTYPHFAHRLAAVVAYVDGHVDILAVRVPTLVQAGPQPHAPVVQQEGLVDGALWSAAGADADAANAAGHSGIAVRWQHSGASVVTVLQNDQSKRRLVLARITVVRATRASVSMCGCGCVVWV